MADKNLVFLAVIALILSFITSETIQRKYKSFRTRVITSFAVTIMALVYFIILLFGLIIFVRIA